MEAEEVFKQIATHMIEGLMFHHQMSEYYLFLGLPGYAECHQYHYLDESCAFNKICHQYILHFNKLLSIERANDPQIIPTSWYKYTRSDVDITTKRNAIKSSLEKWVSWEKETKQLYEACYSELMKKQYIAAALIVKELIEDVTKELQDAEEYLLNKKATDYDMVYIIEEQKIRKDKHLSQERELFLYI